jgi:D-arabinose 1-dehydrogenase-like Zn-dependent alcohol dehydrogenase
VDGDQWDEALGQPGGKGEKSLIQGTGGVAINTLQIAKASGAEGMRSSSTHLFLRIFVDDRG